MDLLDLPCVDFTVKETFKDVRTMFELSNGKCISFDHTNSILHWTHNGENKSLLIVNCQPIGVHGTNFYFSNKKLDRSFGIFKAPCDPFYMGSQMLEKGTGQLEMELKKEMYEIYGQRTYIHDGNFFALKSMIPYESEGTIEKFNPSMGTREVKGLGYINATSGFFKFRDTLFIHADTLIYAVKMDDFSIRRLKTNLRRSYDIPKKTVSVSEDGEMIFTSTVGAIVETTVWSGRLPEGFIDSC